MPQQISRRTPVSRCGSNVDLGPGGEGAFQPALSPDGRYLAFVASREGKRLLSIRSLDTLENRALEGTEDVEYPFWSADSQWIAFGAEGKLKKLRVTGGFPETLCDLPGGPDFRGGTWNGEGAILFASGQGPVYTVSAGGGSARALTVLDSARQETTHRWPSFLPDGRHFLYTARSQRPEYHGIYIGSLDSADRMLIVNALSNASFAKPGLLFFARENDLYAQRCDSNQLAVVGEPVLLEQDVRYASGSARSLFTVSGELLAYLSASETSASLVAVARDGRQLDVIGAGTVSAVSKNGLHVAVQRIDSATGTADIWVINTERRLETRATRHPGYDQDAVWAPDGGRLVFSSQREGAAKLFSAPASGNGPEERLIDTTTFNRPSDWSADGRFIAYTNADLQTNLDVWALPLVGERWPIEIARSEFAEAEGRFSPDTRWIAYSSDDSGESEVYVQAFPARGERWRVSDAGGSAPKWRQDGKELFYLRSDGMLMGVPILTMAGEPRFGVPVPLFDATLFNTDREQAPPYDVSPDGQRFIVPAIAGMSSRLTVVLNWAAALAR